MTYFDTEYELTSRRRRRSRMERMRRTVMRWKIIAALLATGLILALLHPLCEAETVTAETPPTASAPAVQAAPAPIAASGEIPAAKKPSYSLSMKEATITHYCICEKCCGKTPDHPAYGLTASGRPAEPYVSVAVDPYIIPLGSTVYIDYGDGDLHEYRADDTGSGVTGAHIDICVSSHEEALQLGVRTATVYVEEDPNL